MGLGIEGDVLKYEVAGIRGQKVETSASGLGKIGVLRAMYVFQL
jgi:hypothetical protein